MTVIARIMGRMQKMDKDVYWLIDQVHRREPAVPVNSAMTLYEVLDSCHDNLLFTLGDYLDKVDITDFDVPQYAEMYHWFFTDLVASSDPKVTVDDQARKIIELNKLIQRTTTFRNRDQRSTVILPTGDGNAIGFKDNPEKPLLLAIELHKAINEYNARQSPKRKIEVRIGLSTGSVYKIRDLLGNSNVWGPGIIYARRVMDLGRTGSILANDIFANGVQKLKPEFKKLLHLIGNYPIKHEVIPIYNVYGSVDGVDIGTKKNPIARRVQKSAADTEFRRTISTFLFAKIEIILDVIDTHTMLTHHTWTWHVINQTNEPVDRVFYYLEGDKPRDFPDLNVKVTDEDNKELQIKSLNVNKPDKKEFFVQLNKQLKPRQGGRFVKLEYDWEEIDRHFYYTFSSDCKKFRFLLIVPKGLSISQKVAKVSPETGDITYAKTPASVRYLRDKTEIEWVAANISAFDAYRFDW
jgi:hypothetical protein